jgi:hypothetical protein
LKYRLPYSSRVRLSGKPVLLGASITATGAGTDTGFGRGLVGFGKGLIAFFGCAGLVGAEAVTGFGKGLMVVLGRAGIFGAETVVGFVVACVIGLATGVDGFTTGRDCAATGAVTGWLETVGLAATGGATGFATGATCGFDGLTGADATGGVTGLTGGLVLGLIGFVDVLTLLAGFTGAVEATALGFGVVAVCGGLLALGEGEAVGGFAGVWTGF